MSVIPKELVPKIEFFENHNTPWSSNAVAIGTTAGEVTALATKTTAARAAFNAQQAAQEAAKAATLDLKNKVTAMVDAGSDIIKKVKAKAATDGDNVYVLAQIPAPATPAPIGPPGTPSDFKVALNGDGSLTLAWKCANPVNATGTIYQVSRRIGSGGDFAIIGATGLRSFVDATLPLGAGSGTVSYRILAVRSTVTGMPATFIVTFGVGGSGQMMASVVSALGEPRLAA